MQSRMCYHMPLDDFICSPTRLLITLASQVVYRPGLFDLRAFSQACSKLKASSDYADGQFSNELGEFSSTLSGQAKTLT